MTKREYRAQLKDPRWIVRRCQRIIVAGGMCERCDDTERINVHHKFYVDGRQAWEYCDGELEVLCRRCHKEEHNIKSRRPCAEIKAPQRCIHESAFLSGLAIVSQYRADIAKKAAWITVLSGVIWSPWIKSKTGHSIIGEGLKNGDSCHLTQH